jgi:putative membrane protein
MMMPGFGWNGCCGFGSFGSMGWIGWIINIVLMGAVLIGVVMLVIWAVRRITNNQPGSNLSSSQPGSGLATARNIVQTRYARGEISREEYQQMLEDIG